MNKKKKHTKYKKCHQDIVSVFETTHNNKKIIFTAGGKSRKGNWLTSSDQPDLVIGPMQVVNAPVISQTLTNINDVLPKFALFDFPDFRIPIIPNKFWKALVKEINENPNITKVHSMCQGGHGRTGVILSILYGLLLPQKTKTVDDIVKHLRDKYCKQIVENTDQFNYIALITEKPYNKTLEGSKVIDNSQNDFWNQPYQYDRFNSLSSHRQLPFSPKQTTYSSINLTSKIINSPLVMILEDLQKRRFSILVLRSAASIMATKNNYWIAKDKKTYRLDGKMFGARKFNTLEDLVIFLKKETENERKKELSPKLYTGHA